MKKYKILYISDWGGWGGAQKVVLTLIKSLNREKYELHFILGSDGLFAQSLKTEGVSVQVVPMTPMSIPDSKKYASYLYIILFFWRLLIYTFKIYLITRRIRPDLIQTCSIQAKIIGSFVAKFAKVKLLWHVQNIQPPGFRRKIVRFLAAKQFPDMIVATSQAVANVYVDVIQADKLKVNHAGIDQADFIDLDKTEVRRNLRAELGLAQEKVVVSASMIRHWKGLHIFVRAAQEVLKHHSNVKFLIVGDTQFTKDKIYKEQLLDLVSELGLTDNLKFLGFRKDVYHIIAAADCLVHCPIKSDPLPNVVLEGMAVQTPIVGTATGGIPEEIEDHATGILVGPNNEKELAKGILQILENPNLAKSFTQAAKQKLEAEFLHQLYVNRFERIYATLLV